VSSKDARLCAIPLAPERFALLSSSAAIRLSTIERTLSIAVISPPQIRCQTLYQNPLYLPLCHGLQTKVMTKTAALPTNLRNQYKFSRSTSLCHESSTPNAACAQNAAATTVIFNIFI
jgi:hypothetical protein